MKRILSLLVLILVVSGCASTKKTAFIESSASVYEANKKVEHVLNNPNENAFLELIDRDASETYVKNELGIDDPKFALKSAFVSAGAMMGLSSFDHIFYTHSREQGDYWLSQYIFSHDNGTFALVDITLTKQGYKLVDVNNRSYRSSVVRFFAQYDQQIEAAGHEEVVTAITDLMEKKESQLALEKYQQLPSELKSLPIVHETLFRSIETCDGKQHQELCKTLLQEGNQAYQGLFEANLYRTMGQYEQALTKFEQLPEDIRFSPPILMEKAMVLAQLGQKREAFGIALDALYRNASGAYGYLIMLQVAFITGEHDAAVELLTFMKDIFEIQFSEQELADISNSESFLNSTQYAQFKHSYL
ncbi:tetratricopeptide repeat protein [Pseudoalteromonas rubra]|uniref:tetratricopeptide repeat protein n=1 Tax=Pseudoalteromonas rubra TaxID=43658 RepID=UPI000F765E3A|nr:lipoprotein [Pseudoalteromonas rubra]